ncbi:MAG: OmpH family outer membrane protein [Mariprofundaceae bacterium]
MLKYLWIMVVLSTTLISGSLSAAEMKIAYVDSRSAVQNTLAYKEGMKQLEAEKSAKEKELKSLNQRVRDIQQEMMSQAMVMSPAQQAKKQEELGDLQKLFTRKQQDGQEELQRGLQRVNQGIYAKFVKAVRKYGKESSYDLILLKSEVIYGKTQHDVTAEITKILDKEK